MPQTIFACYKEDPRTHLKEVVDTLVFDSDTFEGDELVANLTTYTEDYLALKMIDDEDAYYEKYDYALDEYGFDTIADMLDDEEEDGYIDYLAERDIEYIGHEETIVIAVCQDDDLILSDATVEAAKNFILEHGEDQI